MQDLTPAELRPYGFAYRTLPQLFLAETHDGPRDLRAAPLAEVAAALRFGWHALAPAEPIDPAPRPALVDAGGARALLITMPEPTFSPEAYYVLWLQRGGENQLFAWERPHDLADGPVLGAPGITSHANYGHRPGDYGRDAFLAAVTAQTGIPLRVTEEAPTPGVMPRSSLRELQREPRTPLTIARDVFLGLIGVLFVVLCLAAIYFSFLR